MLKQAKKSVNPTNWKLEAYQQRSKLPTSYIPIYLFHFPELDNEEEKVHVNAYLNGRRYDEGIKNRIAQILDTKR